MPRPAPNPGRAMGGGWRLPCRRVPGQAVVSGCEGRTPPAAQHQGRQPGPATSIHSCPATAAPNAGFVKKATALRCWSMAGARAGVSPAAVRHSARSRGRPSSCHPPPQLGQTRHPRLLSGYGSRWSLCCSAPRARATAQARHGWAARGGAAAAAASLQAPPFAHLVDKHFIL